MATAVLRQVPAAVLQPAIELHICVRCCKASPRVGPCVKKMVQLIVHIVHTMEANAVWFVVSLPLHLVLADVFYLDAGNSLAAGTWHHPVLYQRTRLWARDPQIQACSGHSKCFQPLHSWLQLRDEALLFG